MTANLPENVAAAIKEAIAALWVAHERLCMNDLEGEEKPFIEDCETALALLEGL